MPEPAAARSFDDYLSEPAIDALIARPGFRQACEEAAAAAVADYLALHPAYRWLMKDIGRAGIGLTAYLLDLTDTGLTAQALRAQCKTYGVASAGRVTQVLTRLLELGDLTLEDGPGRWTQRRLILGPRFLDAFLRRMIVFGAPLSRIAPDAPALERLADEDYRRGFVARAAAISIARRGLFAASYHPATELFLEREAGMLMLYDFVGQQAAERTQLLQRATLSRNALARRFEVSRAHINKLLGDAAAAGLVRQEASDLVVFERVLSSAVERLFAHMFQLMRAAAAGG